MTTYMVNNAEKLEPADKTFCDLPPAVADALEQEALTTTYPTGAVLFAEGQAPQQVLFRYRYGADRVEEFAVILPWLYLSSAPAVGRGAALPPAAAQGRPDY